MKITSTFYTMKFNIPDYCLYLYYCITYLISPMKVKYHHWVMTKYAIWLFSYGHDDYDNKTSHVCLEFNVFLFGYEYFIYGDYSYSHRAIFGAFMFVWCVCVHLQVFILHCSCDFDTSYKWLILYSFLLSSSSSLLSSLPGQPCAWDNPGAGWDVLPVVHAVFHGVLSPSQRPCRLCQVSVV